MLRAPAAPLRLSLNLIPAPGDKRISASVYPLSTLRMSLNLLRFPGETPIEIESQSQRAIEIESQSHPVEIESQSQ